MWFRVVPEIKDSRPSASVRVQSVAPGTAPPPRRVIPHLVGQPAAQAPCVASPLLIGRVAVLTEDALDQPPEIGAVERTTGEISTLDLSFILQDAQLLGRLDVVSEVAAGCVGFARAPDGFYVQDWIELHCQRFLRDLDEHVDAHLGRAADSGDDPDPEPEREQPVA